MGLKKIQLLVLQILLLACAAILTGSSAAQAKTRELIIVIDKSMSMLDEFDTAKDQAKSFAASAQVGDRVTIITFGNSAHLLERVRVKSSGDIARVLSEIDEIAPTDFATVLSAGMERSLEELQGGYSENAENEREVLWLSDDKNNTPPELGGLLNFVQLKKKEARRMPERDWFAFRSPLRQQESDIDWFVPWANRRETPLHVRLDTVQLVVTPPDVRREIQVLFEPEDPAAQEISFSAVAEVADVSGPPRFVTVPIRPETVICKARAWEESFSLTLPDKAGTYACKISFVLPSEKILKIVPPQVSLKATVRPMVVKAKQPDVLAAALADAAARAQNRSLSIAERGDGAQEPEILSRGITFGPISAGKKYVQKISLQTKPDLTPETLGIVLNFQLPQGLELRPTFLSFGDGIAAEITLVADSSFHFSGKWEKNGAIRFTADEQAKIVPEEIPIHLFAMGQPAVGSRPADPPGSGWIDKLLALTSRFLVAIKIFLTSGTLLLAFYFIRRYVVAGEGLNGILEVIDNQTGKVTRTINLRRLGRLKGRSFLIIGRSKEADIVLGDASVAEIHAKLSAAKTSAGTLLFVRPLSHPSFFVNGLPCTKARELSNGDILRLGNIRIFYRRRELLKETILCFNDGRLLRGILTTWDIDAKRFEFLPKGVPSVEDKMLVDFAELKWTSFVGKKKRRLLNKMRGSNGSAGRFAEIIMKDGEVLEGYVLNDLAAWNERFYLIPRESSERSLYLVERAAVQNIFLRELEKPRMSEILRNLSSRHGAQKN